MDFKYVNFKKKYGQNFLVDKNIVKKIVNSIEILPSSLVIEIGCGDGKLTQELCSNFDYVLGYEIDNELRDYLLNNLNDYNNYKIIFSDFMKSDILSDIKEINFDNLYVVANLPYYITTPILSKIITSKLGVKEIYVMVQKEVSDRFSAKIGSKDYGSLSVYLNYYFDIKKLFDVNRNSFVPKPNVDSSIVCFKEKKEKKNVENEELFFKLVRDSFQFKRKTLRNNLKDYNLEKIEKTLSKYNLDLSVRAENLSLDIFIDIANNL